MLPPPRETGYGMNPIRVEEVADHIAGWLRERASEAGALGAVVGVSGGVDSAVVAALCLRAFPQTTLGIILPCHGDPRDTRDAMRTCEALGLPATTVDLDAVYDALLGALRASGPHPEHRLALANLKPRLRMTTLYYFANRMNRLVAGTGNRSEAYIGYFTKHGDGGVDVLPIAGLVKSEVRALAAYLGVPGDIVERTPSAGLWPGQTDEGEMGLTYAVLDDYLLTGRAPPEARGRIERMHAGSEHKRRTPPFPKIPR